MDRRQVLTGTVAAASGLALVSATAAQAAEMDAESQATFDTVMAFMGAMGKGDMEGMIALMADDIVWQNEGDAAMPWIGPWNGRDEMLKGLGLFSQGFQTTEWVNEDVIARGDTLAVFGRMNGITTASGAEIGEFTFALRAKVKDGKVVLWNWLENSYSVSKAFHGG